MTTETLHLIGRNNDIGGVDLYIGTEDELQEIADAGKSSVYHVTPEEAADPDSGWAEGDGWYYSIYDHGYVKAESRLEALKEVLQHDGHPLYFTVEQAKKILDRSDAGEETGLWHHNEFRVISEIRRRLNERELLPPEEPEAKAFKDWHDNKTVFKVGDRVLVHEDEGTLWEAEVIGFADDLLNLADDKVEGFELPSICEVISK